MSAWEEAEPRVFWLDSPLAPEPAAPLEGAAGADLAIVGGGFTGLWAALEAKRRDPAREVVLLEADRVGAAASGRNGGFVDASLTHGIGNGLAHFPDELERLQALGRRVVPVYDYVLVTEPLSASQRAALGWSGREGVSDAGNRFHYYRLTADDRILWGGFDAIYQYGNRVGPELEQRAASFALLERHFRATFPPLEEVRFSHRWGGAIDNSTRFCATFGTALGGRAAYAVGYTGLGVAASRFGARVALDLLGGRPTELTNLGLVRKRPIPFPPEPLRWASIAVTQRALARADARGRKRGAWLRALDALGAGFDS